MVEHARVAAAEAELSGADRTETEQVDAEQVDADRSSVDQAVQTPDASPPPPLTQGR